MADPKDPDGFDDDWDEFEDFDAPAPSSAAGDDGFDDLDAPAAAPAPADDGFDDFDAPAPASADDDSFDDFDAPADDGFDDFDAPAASAAPPADDDFDDDLDGFDAPAAHAAPATDDDFDDLDAPAGHDDLDGFDEPAASGAARAASIDDELDALAAPPARADRRAAPRESAEGGPRRRRAERAPRVERPPDTGKFDAPGFEEDSPAARPRRPAGDGLPPLGVLGLLKRYVAVDEARRQAVVGKACHCGKCLLCESRYAIRRIEKKNRAQR